MKTICRLCLKGAPVPISIHYTDETGVSTSSLVKSLVPELYLGLSVNPVVCSKCYNYLRQAYIFRLECLRSEKLIGIYIRESKLIASTIDLKDVVAYWIKQYKNKPLDGRTYLKEWFGEKEDQTAEAIILNQKANTSNPTQNVGGLQADVLSEKLKQKLQNEKPLSESGIPVPEREEANPPPKLTEEERTEAEILRLLKEFTSEFETTDKEKKQNHATETTGEEEDGCTCDCTSTIGSYHYNPFCKFYKQRWRRKQTEKDTEIHEEDKSVGDAAAECDENVDSPCQESDSIPELTPIFKPLDKSLPVRTYTKKPKKVAEAPESTDSNIETVYKKRHINLIPHELDDEDINSLIKELQKDENLKKLGFTGSGSEPEGSYILKKFIDKSDNSLSFALLPTTVQPDDTKMKKSDTAHGLNKKPTDWTTYIEDVINGVDRESTENINSTKIASSDENVTTGRLDVMKDTVQASIGTNQKHNESNKVMVQDESDLQRVEHGDVSKLKDPLEGIDTTTSDSKNSFLEKSSQPAQDNDEESLGIITFPADKEKAKPVASLPSKSPSDKPMPVIRVRPVSALQKVRTLNHELWPKHSAHFNANTGFETPTSVVYKVPTKLVENDSSQPPIVLNSKLASTDLITPFESFTSKRLKLRKTYSKPVNNRTVTNPRQATQVNHIGINPLHLKNGNRIKKLRKIKRAPACDALRGDVVQPLIYQNGSNTMCLITSVDSLARGNEDVIDIKDEPLDYTDNDVLTDFAAANKTSQVTTGPEGEKKRKAKGKSVMSPQTSQNDIVKSIVDNIPEVGEDQYDEPEYVHINNVSYADLAKLMDESKMLRQGMHKTQMHGPESNLLQVKLARFKPQISKGQEKTDAGGAMKELTTEKAVYKSRAGKRLRLVQVDEKEMEPPKIRRKKVNQRSLLKKNIVGATPPEKLSARQDERNVCVLYTNFSDTGDYINDHDYLLNPYMRNKMYYRRRNIPVCVCLLCGLIHQAVDHVDHMKNHTTVCQKCQIDFHNVFILNLHVRCHTSYCQECKTTVTYARHLGHARMHNMSVSLSNINILDNVIRNCLDKPEETAPEQVNEKKPISVDRSFRTLKDLLSEPIEDKNLRLMATNVNRRRSSRITRSTKLDEDVCVGDEEACIYDKATGSFITPSAEKQQELLDKCTTYKTKADSYKGNDEGEDVIDVVNVEDGIIKNTVNNKSESITKLLCDEIIDDQNETINISTLLRDTKCSQVQTGEIFRQQSDSTQIKPKKIDKTNKKRRARRIFSVRPKRKVRIPKVFQQTQLNMEKSKNENQGGESSNPEANDSFKYDLQETKTDLSVTANVKNSRNGEERSETPNSEQSANDSSKIESLEDPTSISSEKSPLRCGTKSARRNIPKPPNPELFENNLSKPEWNMIDPVDTKPLEGNGIEPSLLGDLTMRSKSIKLNPFVSLTKMSMPVPKTLTTYSKSDSKKNMDIFSVQEGCTTAGNMEVQETSVVNIDTKETTDMKPDANVDKNGELKDDDGSKKDLELNTCTNGTKARSSRSRGSLGLVEGLKGYERRMGCKTSNKSKKRAEEHSLVDLDAQTRKVDPDERFIDNLETLKLKNVELKRPTLNLESSPLNIEQNKISSSTLDASEFKNVQPNESDTIVEVV